MAAVIVTAIDPILRARQHDVRLLGVYGERSHLGFGREAGGDRFPGALTGQAAVQARPNLATGDGLPGQADVQV